MFAKLTGVKVRSGAFLHRFCGCEEPILERIMAAQKIDRSKWQAFFDRLSRGLVGMRAEIEVASLALGDQIEAEWLPLLGIAYDPKDNILEIALEGLDHLISNPKEVWADAGAGALLNFEVIDGEGVCQIIKLRKPLMLPAPGQE
jgi:Family of unknown function (DUF5335)